MTSADAETDPAGINDIGAAAARATSITNNIPAAAKDIAPAKLHLRIERSVLSSAAPETVCDPAILLSDPLCIHRRERH
jgi:hypothetical protein